MAEQVECTHLDTITDVKPRSQVCEPCVALGDTYPAARYCKVCGYVGCCDDSKNHHMIDHHRETGHPIIGPADSAEGWSGWCYVDETYVTV